MLVLLTLPVVLLPATELPLLPSLAPLPSLPLDFLCRRLDLLDDPPYRVRSAALVGAWEADTPSPDGAATADVVAAEGAFAAAAADPLRMKGFFARRATSRRFLFLFPFSFAAPSHPPVTSSLAEPLSEPDPALVDELPDDTLSPPSLSLRNTVRSAVVHDVDGTAATTVAAVGTTPRPREERP